MKYKIVVVRDRAADTFGVPMFVASIGGAVRSFQDEVNRNAQDNAMFNHPEDFDMYELGVYDDEDASFHSIGGPRQVAIGKDCKR